MIAWWRWDDDVAPSPGAALRLTLKFEIGIGNNGTSLRRTLINQPYTAGCWQMRDLVSDHVLRDLGPMGRHATYEGTGFVQGISVDDLPEGGLATRVNGTQQWRVADDGPNAPINMSLAGGSYDKYIYFRTTINDANARGIITKYDPVTQTGHELVLINGCLRERLWVSGSMIFEVTSASVVDGLWKRGQPCYTPESNLAQMYVNGAASGASDTGMTEPIYNDADLILCGWDHLSSTATRFIGDIHYTMLGREGAPALAAAAESTLVWTDVSAWVKGLDIDLGGSDPRALLGATAGIGRASFFMVNSAPVGLWSPGHASAQAGFGLAIPVRITMNDGVTTYPLFRGYVEGTHPATGPLLERTVAVDCVDWTDTESVEPIGPVEVLLDKSSSYCIQRLFDQVRQPPVAVSIDGGNEVFPFAFDQIDAVNGKILQETAEIVRCEGGARYISRDGTVHVEARQRRQLPQEATTVLRGDWQTMEAGTSLQDIINAQRAMVFPREYGLGTNTVLVGTVTAGSNARRQELIPGDPFIFEGSYSDPLEKATSVGAINIQPLVPYTDYTMTEFEDGGGVDLTTYVQIVSQPASGSSYSIEVLNTHTSIIGWIHYQVRGQILRRFDPVGVVHIDEDSRNRYRHREASMLSLKYLSRAEAGLARCRFMVNMFKDEKVRPRTMTTLLNPNSSVMTNFLTMDMGSYVKIAEPVAAITEEIGYWVQGLHYSFREGNILTMTVDLVPSVITAPVGIVGHPVYGLVGTAVVGY